MGRATRAEQHRPDRAAIGVASRADDLPYVCRSEAMDAAAAHVLVFPWPRQGHINPMLHLAAALVDAGVRVTFLHTDHSLRRLAQAPPPPRAMHVLSVPDDHPRGFLDLMDSMCATSGPAYRALLSSLVFGADDAPPVTCVVADGTMPFAVEVAEELGVPALAFAAHSACSYLAFLSTPELIELGETAFPMDDPVRGVPGMEGFLRRRDLPRGLHCVEQGDADPLVLKIAEVIARSCKATRALVVNTAASMERPALAHIASRTATDVFAVGPLHARLAATASSNASLWREDDGCMVWLDGQEDRSVVYVSLGSLAVITHEQFTEFLAGLAATGHAFLWVLRPDMVRTTSPALLREAVGAAAGGGDKARVVEWAPQRDVLRHMAVGCFLTHAGWNSTLECAVEGVPMVCWPFFADQQTNSRFVGAVWGTGLDMKDVCDRGVVARTVREAMASDKTRAAAGAMARQLRLDVAEAGSSSSELERLVRFIRELSLKPRINED